MKTTKSFKHWMCDIGFGIEFLHNLEIRSRKAVDIPTSSAYQRIASTSRELGFTSEDEEWSRAIYYCSSFPIRGSMADRKQASNSWSEKRSTERRALCRISSLAEGDSANMVSMASA